MSRFICSQVRIEKLLLVFWICLFYLWSLQLESVNVWRSVINPLVWQEIVVHDTLQNHSDYLIWYMQYFFSNSNFCIKQYLEKRKKLVKERKNILMFTFLPWHSPILITELSLRLYHRNDLSTVSIRALFSDFQKFYFFWFFHVQKPKR